LSKTHKISIEEVVSIWNKALPHLAYEIHIPNQNKVKKSDKDEEKEHKEVEDEKECKCQFVLTRGKNKGESCGKKTVKDSDFCVTHNKKASVQKEEEDSQKVEKEKVEKEKVEKEKVEKEKVEKVSKDDEHVCKYVLTRGKNKAEKCKKKRTKYGERFDYALELYKHPVKTRRETLGVFRSETLKTEFETNDSDLVFSDRRRHSMGGKRKSRRSKRRKTSKRKNRKHKTRKHIK
jgi:hypothetical protein